MRTSLALVAALALTSPVPVAMARSATAEAPSVAATTPDEVGLDGGDTRLEPHDADGEVRPGPADRIVFAVADLLTRVERFGARLQQAAEEARYAELELSEPYYGGVGEDSVRIASAVTGQPVGATLDHDTAEALVQRARDDMAPTFALAGVGGADLTRDGLARAAEKLGIELGDGPIEPATLAKLRATSDERLVPALVALGREPGNRVSREDLAPVMATLGDDPGQLDAGALARVVSEAHYRLAPLAYATGMRHDELVSASGLRRALERVGVDYGSTVDAADVTAGVRASERRLTLTPPRSLGGSLTHRRVYAPARDGPVSGHLLRWRTDDAGGVSVQADLAGSFNRRASVPSAARRARDAAAVVNGGYWAQGGDPDGLLVTDGRLTSSRETLRDWVRGVRTAFGLHADGTAVVGTPEFGFRVELPSGTIEVDGVDRPVGGHEAVLYTDRRFLRPLPDDVVTTVLPAPASLVTSSRTRFRVASRGVRDDVPRDRLLLVTRGRKAAAVAAAEGTEATLVVEVGTAWEGVGQAMSGGPWLLRDGVVPDVEEWRTEGFGAGHTDRRHPRTAIGFDGAGNGVILTVDGRQPGYSVGLSHRGMGELMAALGVRDAVMLDGGGSSQMVVKGSLVNRPCCDASTRPLATALYLRTG